MKKKLFGLVLTLLTLSALMCPASAVYTGPQEAAETLYELGLFRGTATNPDGTPVYSLEQTPSRNQAVIMLVRLLGKEQEALAGNWDLPFTDVPKNSTAYPYIGYAYAHGLTNGTTATTYSGVAPIRANQYITFVLRAMGYVSGTDFQVSTAWTLSDKLGFTHGEYNAATADNFIRADVALISANALSAPLKGIHLPLSDKLIVEGVFTEARYAVVTGAAEEPEEEEPAQKPSSSRPSAKPSVKPSVPETEDKPEDTPSSGDSDVILPDDDFGDSTGSSGGSGSSTPSYRPESGGNIILPDDEFE